MDIQNLKGRSPEIVGPKNCLLFLWFYDDILTSARISSQWKINYGVSPTYSKISWTLVNKRLRATTAFWSNTARVWHCLHSLEDNRTEPNFPTCSVMSRIRKSTWKFSHDTPLKRRVQNCRILVILHWHTSADNSQWNELCRKTTQSPLHLPQNNEILRINDWVPRGGFFDPMSRSLPCAWHARAAVRLQPVSVATVSC